MKHIHNILPFSFVVFLAMTVSSCYKDELRDLHKQIEQTRDVKIPSLVEQISRVQASLDDFDQINIELEGYIKSLEQSTSSTEKTIAELQGAIIAFDESSEKDLSGELTTYTSRIESMKSAFSSYLEKVLLVTDELKSDQNAFSSRIDAMKLQFDASFAEKSWFDGTVATKERQKEISGILGEINSLKKTLETTISGLSSKMTVYVDSTLRSESEVFSGTLKEKSDAVIKDCESQINALKNSIEGDCSRNVSNSIAASQDSVKNWVSSGLSGYLSVIEAQTKINAFIKLVGVVPGGKNLQSEIICVSDTLSGLSSAIESAYSDAISEAISKHEGVLTGYAISSLDSLYNEDISPLHSSVTSIESQVDALLSRVEGLDSRVSTVEEQAGKLSKSLSDLQSMHSTLSEAVEKLNREMNSADETNRKAIQNLIDDYSKIVDMYGSQISDLKKLLGTYPATQGANTLAEWIELSLNALETQFSSYMKGSEAKSALEKIIEDLNKSSLLKSQKDELSSLSSRLSNGLDGLFNQIKGWLGQELEGYAKLAGMTSALSGMQSELVTMFGAEDSKLGNSISELEQKLTNDKGEIEAAYKKAISDAISNDAGYLNDTVRKTVKSINSSLDVYAGNVNAIKSDVNGLKQDIDLMKSDLDTLNTAVGSFGSFFGSFIKGYEDTDLAEIVKSLQNRIDVCTSDISKSGTGIAAMKNRINGMADTVSILGHMTDDLSLVGKQIDTLESFLVHNAGDSLNSILESIHKRMKECVDTSNLSVMTAQVREISGTMSKLAGLINDMSVLRSDLDESKAFLKNHNDGKGKKLSELIAEITDEIENLSKLEMLGSKDNTLKKKIDDTWEMIYGKGGSMNDAKEGSLIARIDTLKAKLMAYNLATGFNSIVYLPETFSQSVTLSIGTSDASATIQFIVSPYSVAEFLAKTENSKYVKMKWMVTGQSPVDFETQSFSLEKGMLKVKVKDSNIRQYAMSYVSLHAALYVEVPLDSKDVITFTSDFIPMEAPKY